MFQIDRAETRLRKLEEKRFADLQLRERRYPQRRNRELRVAEKGAA